MTFIAQEHIEPSEDTDGQNRESEGEEEVQDRKSEREEEVQTPVRRTRSNKVSGTCVNTHMPILIHF